jgi:hypothetical protein
LAGLVRGDGQMQIGAKLFQQDFTFFVRFCGWDGCGFNVAMRRRCRLLTELENLFVAGSTQMLRRRR